MNRYAQVDWGRDEAKDDPNLSKYFVEFPEYTDILNGNIRYIIGRKGMGKSAIIEKITYDIGDKYDCRHQHISLRDFPINYLIRLQDKGMRDKSKFSPVWIFLILIEICRFIIEDESLFDTQAKQDLAQFIKSNFPEPYSMSETVAYLHSNESKIGILPKWIGIEDKKTESQSTTTFIHFHKANQNIVKIIQSLPIKCKYYLLMDELDEGYRKEDANNRLLILALMKSCEDVSRLLNTADSRIFFPVLALRSDIFESLDDNDLNKLDDYIFKLSWISNGDGVKSLKNVVNARIKAAFPNRGPVVWEDIVDNYDRDLPGSIDSVWKYVVNRTFERPRDLIKFLKLCKNSCKGNMLSFEDVKHAEHEYSKWFFRELGNEINPYLPVWRESLGCITKIGRGKFSFKEFDEALTADATVKNWLEQNKVTSNEVCEILFSFSAIGNINNEGRWLFRYKDESIPWNPKNDIIIHYGLSKKLRVRT